MSQSSGAVKKIKAPLLLRFSFLDDSNFTILRKIYYNPNGSFSSLSLSAERLLHLGENGWLTVASGSPPHVLLCTVLSCIEAQY